MGTHLFFCLSNNTEALQEFVDTLPSIELFGWEPHARTWDWVLISEPWFVIFIIGAYLAAIFIGVQIMKNFQPFDLFYFRVAHNAFMVVLSAYMCWELAYGTIVSLGHGFHFWGIPIEDENSEGAMRVANALWLFSVSKIYEFLDTVFMVLRKRNRQINLLHVPPCVDCLRVACGEHAVLSRRRLVVGCFPQLACPRRHVRLLPHGYPQDPLLFQKVHHHVPDPPVCLLCRTGRLRPHLALLLPQLCHGIQPLLRCLAPCPLYPLLPCFLQEKVGLN